VRPIADRWTIGLGALCFGGNQRKTVRLFKCPGPLIVPGPSPNAAPQEISMPDDKTKRGQSDRARINIEESYEIKHWVERFNISPDKLKDAVAKVGPMADNVAKYLQKEF
jgi:hypothetical protein